MRNGSRNTNPPAMSEASEDAETLRITTGFLLPIEAKVALMATRDELRLLSHLAEPRSEDDRDEVVLSTEALSDCFARIATSLDAVLEATKRKYA